jgi:hypothetical protein
MFAALAPKLRDNGWGAVMPVANPGKRPLVSGWDAYNRAPPNDHEVDAWCTTYPNAGIGFAYGPDGVLGVDLDFLDPAVAARADSIVGEVLGHSECVRIGRLPKSLLLYRATPGLSVPGKAFGGYELFSSSGQTVLYGTHPDTATPYYWPDRSPEDVSPNDLPLVGQTALSSMIEALAPLCSRVGYTRPAGAAYGGGGRVAAWLRTFNRTNAKPVDLCRVAIEAAPEGDRYPTAFSAIAALVRVGLTDTDIIQHIVEPYLARFDQRSRPERHRAIMSGLRWARVQIGADAEAIAAALHSNQIFASWRARWQHGK